MQVLFIYNTVEGWLFTAYKFFKLQIVFINCHSGDNTDLVYNTVLMEGKVKMLLIML